MADKKIADLNEATTATDTDILIIEDNANTKKITWANLKTAIIGAFSSILGNRTYTEQNVVTNGESITNSINELDKGVIVESGSNANGSWVKWADGTMECWGTIIKEDYSNFNVTSGGFRTGAGIYSLPQAFIDTNYKIVASNTDLVAFGVFARPETNSTFLSAFKTISYYDTPTTYIGTYIAIGRWK